MTASVPLEVSRSISIEGRAPGDELGKLDLFDAWERRSSVRASRAARIAATTPG